MQALLPPVLSNGIVSSTYNVYYELLKIATICMVIIVIIIVIIIIITIFDKSRRVEILTGLIFIYTYFNQILWQ